MEYELSFPEDILIQVANRAKAPYGWEVLSTTIINPYSINGAATYENHDTGLLHYAIKDILEPLATGHYVVTGFHATYTNKDRLEFHYQEVRQATEKEIQIMGN